PLTGSVGQISLAGQMESGLTINDCREPTVAVPYLNLMFSVNAISPLQLGVGDRPWRTDRLQSEARDSRKRSPGAGPRIRPPRRRSSGPPLVPRRFQVSQIVVDEGQPAESVMANDRAALAQSRLLPLF